MSNFAFPPPRRHRGNPRWVNPAAMAQVPPQPAAWDRLLYRLALRKDEDAVQALKQGGEAAGVIRQWVRGNRNRFIPELVLEEMGEREAVEGAPWWGSGNWKR